MSLITTTTLAALWKEAHSSDAGEPEAVAFWQHYLSKFAFKEERWICDAEIRPEPGSRRRVDRGVRFVQPSGEIIVLCWLEAKGDSSKAKLREAEKQALDACEKNLRSHDWQNHIYALTTGKTMAKAWIYEKGYRELLPLHGHEYIEANSSEATQISVWFDRMKNFLPGAVADHPTMTRITDTAPTQSYSNPIFPNTTNPTSTQRHLDSNLSQEQPVTASNIKSLYRAVKHAKRDPRNANVLLVEGRSVEGWKGIGAGETMILYCEARKMYIYKENIR